MCKIEWEALNMMVRLRERERHVGNQSTPNRRKRLNSHGSVSSTASSPRRGQEEHDQKKPVTVQRKIRVQWRLLSPCVRLSISLTALWVIFCLWIIFWDYFHLSYRDAGLVSRSSTEHYAVVINTYKRPQQLREAVQHYAVTCGPKYQVGHVYVVWAQQDASPPQVSTLFEKDQLRRPGFQDNVPSEVKILRVPKDSLNSRFLPIQGLTEESIFMVDDDVRVDCESLQRGFIAWKSNPDTMVGYYPRLALPKTGSKDHFVYQSWPKVFWKQNVNFVLTKACFLHQRYLELYSSDQHPQVVRDYVDKYFNCEDVAMSLLVANVTKAASPTSTAATPIYVEASVADLGLFNGISTGSGHMNQRSKCLTDITRIYHDRGWPTPLDDIFQLSDAAWSLHSPGFWWQHHPSNFFEWFAVENLLS